MSAACAPFATTSAAADARKSPLIGVIYVSKLRNPKRDLLPGAKCTPRLQCRPACPPGIRPFFHIAPECLPVLHNSFVNVDDRKDGSGILFPDVVKLARLCHIVMPLT